MEITIKVANVGQERGTVGDLVKGLDSGKYFFQEGKATNGDVGLWLKAQDKSLSQCVAIFNPYNLISGHGDFDPFQFYLSQSVDRNDREIWTKAAWTAICNVAKKWCDDRNSELDSEVIPEIHLVRISS